VVTGYLSVIVLLPLAALVWEAHKGGLSGFWKTITAPEAVAAIELTLVVSVIVALINAVAGTAIAWVLVRDKFPVRPGETKITSKLLGGWRAVDKKWFDP
jgi:sulfate transport system permease protein